MTTNAEIENDPRVQRAAENLNRQLGQLYLGAQFTKRVFDEACELVQWHRKQCLSRGIQFPKLVVLPLIKQRAIEVVRADMDLQGIRTTMLNLTVKYPSITAQEIAEAVQGAFPDYIKSIDVEKRREVKKSSITLN